MHAPGYKQATFQRVLTKLLRNHKIVPPYNFMQRVGFPAGPQRST